MKSARSIRRKLHPPKRSITSIDASQLNKRNKVIFAICFFLMMCQVAASITAGVVAHREGKCHSPGGPVKLL